MKLSKITKTLLTVMPAFVALAIFLVPNMSQAKVSMPSILDNTSFTSIGSIITFIFNTLIIVGAVVVFVMFAIGGIIYLTGAGNEEQTGKAKKLLIDAIIGFAIVLAAYALARFVLGLFLNGNSSLPSID